MLTRRSPAARLLPARFWRWGTPTLLYVDKTAGRGDAREAYQVAGTQSVRTPHSLEPAGATAQENA